MGVAQSSGTKSDVSDAEQRALFTFPSGLDAKLRSQYSGDCLCGHWPHDDALGDMTRVNLMAQLRLGGADTASALGPRMDRCLGAWMGNVVGDALGAPFEFSPVRYDGVQECCGLDDVAVWTKPGYNRFRLKPGQWTDDFSMAQCLADSLLLRSGFDAHDLRLRFLNWWEMGYANAFGYDAQRTPGSSVGLGGNIGSSFREFKQSRTEFTAAGNLHTSGNGSAMRLSAVPIYYHRDVDVAMQVAYQQSKTTHQGEEAAECCRLMTWLIVHAIQRQPGTAQEAMACLDDFQTPLYSVQCLARGEREAAHASNADLQLEDRRWNWKSRNFRFCASRAQAQPGYVGSYVMDGLAMALHVLWSTQSFPECLLKIANMRGDSDTTAAICGQMAGAVYGVSNIPTSWMGAIWKWDNNGCTSWRGYLLTQALEKQEEDAT